MAGIIVFAILVLSLIVGVLIVNIDGCCFKEDKKITATLDLDKTIDIAKDIITKPIEECSNPYKIMFLEEKFYCAREIE